MNCRSGCRKSSSKMTILPKKKHQESRKNDQDHDTDNRNRVRNRSTHTHNTIRNNRLQQHPTPDEFDFDDIGTGLEASVPPLTPPRPMFNDLESRDTHHEGLPHKRSRHKQGSSSSYFLSPNPSPSNSHHSSSRLREESPLDERNEDGYNSSDEHGPSSTRVDDMAVSKVSLKLKFITHYYIINGRSISAGWICISILQRGT